MSNTEEPQLWVVYQMTVHGKRTGGSAVCQQWEWDAMERLEPGRHTLIRESISNEGEVEALARRSSVAANTNNTVAKKSTRL
jgi:hypothetical protein